MRFAKTSAGIGAIALIALTGCAVQTPSTESGSVTDQKVVIACGNVEELCESVLTKFTESTAHPGELRCLSGGEILARLESNVWRTIVRIRCLVGWASGDVRDCCRTRFARRVRLTGTRRHPGSVAGC